MIPAFNEERAIATVVGGAAPFGHVIVVDDASSDATAAVATRHGAQVVRLAVNGGYDRALQAGATRAKELGCCCFVTMDADGQHDPDLIGEFLERLRAGADVVVGSRDHLQRFAERLFALLGRWLWNIEDPLCGMKCYRMTLFDRLGHFDSYDSIGTELALYAASCGLTIVNLRIRTRSRPGASRFGSGWRANSRILRALVHGLWRTGWQWRGAAA